VLAIHCSNTWSTTATFLTLPTKSSQARPILAQPIYQIITGATDTRSGARKLAERAYDSLAGSVADDVSADVSSWINERLRTGPDRLAGRPWAGELGNAIVEQGVGYVINGAAEAIKERAMERAGQLWNQVTGSTPPPENTLERAEYDLWEHAKPTNLLLSTLPLRGTAAVEGLYEWGTGLVDRFSTFMGFAVEDIAK
jgi:hypothetical protein